MAYKSGEPSWLWRRSVTIGILLFGLFLLWTMVDAADTMVNRSIVEGAVIMVLSFGLGYVGFATAQDIAAIWSTKSGLPYKEPPNELGDNRDGL